MNRLLFLLMLLAFAVSASHTVQAQSTAATVSALQDAAPAPALSTGGTATIGGPFSLLNQNGTRITEQTFRGRYMLVTFGYTNCGADCSPAPALMTQALSQLSPEKSAKIFPVFVTLDPARDTSPVLKAFLQSYGSRMVGLTGSPGEIDRMAKSYLVDYRPVEDPGTAIERKLAPQDLAALRADPEYRREAANPYIITHSPFIYLMDDKGQFMQLFGPATQADALTKAITEAIK